MKQGDIFSRMSSETRLRQVAMRKYHFQEVYHSPDELLADLTLLIGKLDSMETSRDQISLDARRLINAKDEMINDISAAFKRFSDLFNIKLPDRAILSGDLPNAQDNRAVQPLNNKNQHVDTRSG